jgi:ParB family chromosome partitioning protein
MSDTQLKQNKIFWIDVDTISPNPYQPRMEFDEAALRDLADSIRQYGVLQPVTVTEAGTMEDGRTKYELIAGERRTRASRLAGLKQIPAVIRVGDDDGSRFELAIIENLQREDLNPIDRAKAFLRLVEEFGLTHAQIGKKMGKSRAYVSNSLRLLSLPPEIKQALQEHKISEGHTRPLMMLEDRPEEQMTLFKEIVYKKMSVRESEKIARKIAHEKVRKEKYKRDPQVAAMEKEFSETLGTRVSIEKGDVGGKIVIDYFSPEDLGDILSILKNESEGSGDAHALLERFAQSFGDAVKDNSETTVTPQEEEPSDIDDTELDIVADPQQELPDEYYKVFDIPFNI